MNELENGKKIASYIRTMRNERGMGQWEFALVSGLSIDLVRKLESGVATQENIMVALSRIKIELAELGVDPKSL